MIKIIFKIWIVAEFDVHLTVVLMDSGGIQEEADVR